MVYPEYANLNRNVDDWGQCQQVPVIFAFVMLIINWVTEKMHIDRHNRNTMMNFSQVLLGLGSLVGCFYFILFIFPLIYFGK